MDTQENKFNDDGSVTIILQEPIKFGQEVIAELKLRKPKAKDIKNLKLNDLRLADFLQIASKLSSTSMAVMDELSVKDSNEVVAKISDFF